MESQVEFCSPQDLSGVSQKKKPTVLQHSPEQLKEIESCSFAVNPRKGFVDLVEIND